MLLAVLGDSLTYGYPFGPKVSWLQTVEEKLAVKILNHGICGETTGDMLLRINSIVREEGLTHLLIFGGANDILLAGRPLADIVADIIHMQNIALSHSLKSGSILPLVPEQYAYKKYFTDLRELIIEKSGKQIFLADLQPALLTGADKVNYFYDGIHLTVEGNSILGEYAASLLKDWLQQEE